MQNVGPGRVTPRRHREVHVGHFFLAGKEDTPEFTGEDEEVLVLFASQVAAAIANARRRVDLPILSVGRGLRDSARKETVRTCVVGYPAS